MSWLQTIADGVITLFGASQARDAAKDTRQVNIEDILRLLGEGDRYNNPNVRGLWTGWERLEGPDGRFISQQTVNPGLEPMLNQGMDRWNAGPQTDQLAALQDANFRSLMGQRGPKPPPQRRSRPPLKAKFRDESGNSIPGYTDWSRVG